MIDAQSTALLEKMKTLHSTLSQVYEMVNSARPTASDISFQCMQSTELAGQEVAPGRTFAQVGEEFADNVESMAALMAAVSGNLALLMGAISE